ncbi:MAG: hypothetical protein GX591_13200 [Planctomycetes bacterium]|nr:hypothetical protein [Planctomycetota bacterium]
MDSPDHAAASPPPPQGGLVDPATLPPYELAISTPCRTCGYDLHGLRTDGRCPECGTAVRLSLRAGLEFAPPAYLRTLGRGMLLKVYGLVFVLAGAVIGGLGGSDEIAAWAARVLVMAAALLWVPGTWLLTLGEPHLADDRRKLTVRVLLRVACTAVLGLVLLWGFGGAEWIRGVPRPVVFALQTALLAAVLAAIAAEAVVLGRLARGLGDPLLAIRTRIEMWGLAISVALSIGGVLPLGLSGPVCCFETLSALGLFVFGLSWPVLLVRYRLSLGDAEHKAAVNWARQIALLERYQQSAAAASPSESA